MHSFALLLVVASASLVSARSIFPRQAPDCLNNCLQNLPYVSACDPTDYTCLCEDPKFLNATTVCIDQNCDLADIITSEQYAVALCESAGVVVTAAPIPSSAYSSSATPTGATLNPASGMSSSSLMSSPMPMSSPMSSSSAMAASSSSLTSMSAWTTMSGSGAAPSPAASQPSSAAAILPRYISSAFLCLLTIAGVFLAL